MQLRLASPTDGSCGWDMGHNQGWTYRERIRATDAGLTLLAYYSHRYCHSSPDEWRDRILAGQICIDGKPAAPEAILATGQYLTYHRSPWVEPPVPLDFEVIYEDSDCLAIAKPAGLPVLPGGGFLENTLWWQLQQRYPDNPPVPVHRLGRGTSGLLLLARSPVARACLSAQFRQGTAVATTRSPSLRKVYRARIGPGPLPDALRIETPIGPVPHPVLGRVHAASDRGRPACSDVRVLQRDRDSTLVAVRIHTGRPHQIRIHLAAIGYPLLGDSFYLPGGSFRIRPTAPGGKLPVPGDCGYHLHAHILTYRHPRDERPVYLQCLPPPQLRLH